MDTLLRYMASEYRKLEPLDLKECIPERSIISANEAEGLEKTVRELRKESGFRK